MPFGKLMLQVIETFIIYICDSEIKFLAANQENVELMSRKCEHLSVFVVVLQR